MKKIYPLIAGVALLAACSKSPYAETNKVYKKQAREYARLLKTYPLPDSTGYAFVGTTNFTMRKPNFVIIHHTAQNSCDQTLRTFTLKRTAVSSHYVICRDGKVYHMLNDYLRGHHAGISKWGQTTDLNSTSIGIELDNNGFEAFAEPQVASLLELLSRLKQTHGIPAANFIGHGDIAPTRKNDPNWRFPWKRLADSGFGLWFDTSLDSLKSDGQHLTHLRLIGYDTRDTTAAKAAFKRHFLQDSTSGRLPLDYRSKQILQNLAKKY